MAAKSKQNWSQLLLSSLLSRQLIPEKSSVSSILNASYRPLIRKSLRLATTNARKVFRTQLNSSAIFSGGDNINPVYDIAYSPVNCQDSRVIAVGDELGYLSIVKVGFEGGRRKRGGGECAVSDGGGNGEYGGDQIYNRGVITTSPTIAEREGRGDNGFGNEDDNEDGAVMQPVLYNVAWNSEGSKILTGYGDGSIRIWDLTKSSRPYCVASIKAFEKSLKRVAWCDETLISCSRTNEILVHDLRMRNPVANRIDCSQLNSKLTDVCVVSSVNILASSSNQSDIHLFDLRYTYKLYKRIKPVQNFNLSSPGYITMKYDEFANDGMVYALGSDSIVRSFDYQSGDVGASYKIPGSVDFFSKIDVDRFSGILISGGSCDSAWGFDLREPYEKGCHVKPFFECKEGKKITWGEDGPNVENEDEESNKENNQTERGSQVDGDGRYHSAVALGTRRGYQDCAFQIACGGDNSTVVVYD